MFCNFVTRNTECGKTFCCESFLRLFFLGSWDLALWFSACNLLQRSLVQRQPLKIYLTTTSSNCKEQIKNNVYFESDKNKKGHLKSRFNFQTLSLALFSSQTYLTMCAFSPVNLSLIISLLCSCVPQKPTCLLARLFVSYFSASHT